MSKFAPGDIVQLKSGGPRMVVQAVCVMPRVNVTTDTTGVLHVIGYECVWFSPDCDLHHGQFFEDVLIGQDPNKVVGINLVPGTPTTHVS
jgi:uncharacterized protein YodC (DUF2158 family)